MYTDAQKTLDDNLQLEHARMSISLTLNRTRTNTHEHTHPHGVH